MDVIFTGRVVDDGMDGTSQTRPERDARFLVEEVFKGLPVDSTSVKVNPSRETDCYFHYETGKRYVMFASRAGDGTLFAGVCTGSDEIGKARDEIAFLRAWVKLPHPDPKTRSITVAVRWWDGAPVTNAVVDCGTDSPDPCTGRAGASAFADAKGRASCTVPAGPPVTVAVWALWEGGDVFKDNFDPVLSELPPGDEPASAEVILDKQKDLRRKLKPSVLSRVPQ
jgi:hypothetical protein